MDMKKAARIVTPCGFRFRTKNPLAYACGFFFCVSSGCDKAPIRELRDTLKIGRSNCADDVIGACVALQAPLVTQ